MILRYPLAERRMLFIVYQCALKGVMFGGAKPLRLCPRKLP